MLRATIFARAGGVIVNGDVNECEVRFVWVVMICRNDRVIKSPTLCMVSSVMRKGNQLVDVFGGRNKHNVRVALSRKANRDGYTTREAKVSVDNE